MYIAGEVKKTPNGHTVKLSKAGVTKEFENNRVSLTTFRYIGEVYAAKKPNLETGRIMYKAQKVVICTVGRPLHKVLESDTDLEGEPIAAMMKAGVAQLHSRTSILR